jgi:hypothetical protein
MDLAFVVLKKPIMSNFVRVKELIISLMIVNEIATI